VVTWQTPPGLKNLLKPDLEDGEDGDDKNSAKLRERNEDQNAQEMDPLFRKRSADQDDDSKDF
jgi:hypothetical protein